MGFAVAENAEKAENTQVGVRHQDVQGVQHKFSESNIVNSTQKSCRLIENQKKNGSEIRMTRERSLYQSFMKKTEVEYFPDGNFL